jgi:hypothetical protein
MEERKRAGATRGRGVGNGMNASERVEGRRARRQMRSR